MAGLPSSTAPSLAVVPPMSKVMTSSKPSCAADAGAHQHARRRARFDDADRVFAREVAAPPAAARGLHDEEVVAVAARGERVLQLRDIAADQRLDVGVGDRRVGALVFAELRARRPTRSTPRDAAPSRGCAGGSRAHAPDWRRRAAATPPPSRGPTSPWRRSLRRATAVSSGFSTLPSWPIRSRTSWMCRRFSRGAGLSI